VRIEAVVFGLHHVDPGHVRNALVIATLDGYNDRLVSYLALDNDVYFSEAFGQAIAHHLGLCDLRSVCEIHSDEIDQSLEIVRALGHEGGVLCGLTSDYMVSGDLQAGDEVCVILEGQTLSAQGSANSS
jgi:hypothetical protein